MGAIQCSVCEVRCLQYNIIPQGVAEDGGCACSVSLLLLRFYTCNSLESQLVPASEMSSLFRTVGKILMQLEFTKQVC